MPIYRICSRCVMDTSDEQIVFDDAGVCNHCKTHESRVAGSPAAQPDAEERLTRLVSTVKAARNGEYDSIIGLSGGVDSSYIAYLASKLGLRPLAVHFDNGWNSELATKNIENIVRKLNIDLITFVIDWEEFSDIQRSFFKANVVDIEMVTDHAIFAAIYQIARKHKVKYVLSGRNVATESIMPLSWAHLKFDLKNLKAIHKKFGTRPIKRFPTLSIWKMGLYHYAGLVKMGNLLEYVPYNKTEAMRVLEGELDWKYYGGKHYESTFTKFYQAHILPEKFGIDKRRAHLSDLIMNGETARERALEELSQPLYQEDELARDQEYVCKKLGIGHNAFGDYMAASPVSHFAYPSYAKVGQALLNFHKRLRGRKAASS